MVRRNYGYGLLELKQCAMLGNVCRTVHKYEISQTVVLNVIVNKS